MKAGAREQDDNVVSLATNTSQMSRDQMGQMPIYQRWQRKVKCTHLVEGVPTLGHDMRLLSWKTKAEGEWFETDGAFFLFF